MLCAINLCQDNTLCTFTKIKLSFLPFDEPNQCNDYLLRHSEYIDPSCSNCPCHYVLNQVNLNTNLLDNVILTKIILRPTKRQGL